MNRLFTHGAAAALLALAGLATPASATNLDLSEVAAALALPIITDRTDTSRTDTSIVITNTSSSNIRLGVQVLSGDPGDDWAANSFTCVVTGHETTEFYFRNEGGTDSEIYFECSDRNATRDSPPRDLNIPRNEDVEAATGIMFVYAASVATERAISNNVLIGESTVIDYTGGYAYQVPAVPIQGVDALAQDGNQVFRFNGMEYARFPSVLTTNFYAEQLRGVTGNFVRSFLILFTLDGTTHSTPPNARLKVDYYNDDERHRDAFHEFDCFDISRLTDIADGFFSHELGSRVGHLTLTPSVADYANAAHEFQFDTGASPGARRVPVHGWLVTKIHGPTCRPDAFGPQRRCIEGPHAAAWGKVLNQGTFSLNPLAGDTPTFNAE